MEWLSLSDLLDILSLSPSQHPFASILLSGRQDNPAGVKDLT
jgi:hypothetical protein